MQILCRHFYFYFFDSYNNYTIKHCACPVLLDLGFWIWDFIHISYSCFLHSTFYILYSNLMGFFQKARDMYALQKQSKQIKRDLKNTHIEAEADGITVVVTGEQDILSININETTWGEFKNHEFGKKRLEEAVQKALNKALKKAQEIGAAKMKGVWGQLGIGG